MNYTVFVKSEDCLVVHFGMEGKVEMAFFLFFLIFSFHELRGFQKSCCFEGAQVGNFSCGTFMHLHCSGSGWLLSFCSVEFSCANIFSSYVVLPEIGGWDSSFAQQPLPCCYFLCLFYFLSFNSCGKSLTQLRAACGHCAGAGWVFVHH